MSLSVKSICLKQTSLQYLTGNVLPNAIVFCSSNEILVGFSNGQLLIFRIPSLEIVCEYCGSDLITAVASLPVFQHKESLAGFDYACITALGLLTFLKRTNSGEKTAFVDLGTLQTPPNPSSLMVGDIDSTGQLELVIGYTDRFARIYKTKITSLGNSFPSVSVELCCSISFTGHVANMCSFYSYKMKSNCLLVSQPGATFVALSFSELPKTGGLFEINEEVRRGPGSQSLLCRSSAKTAWCRPFLQFSDDDTDEEKVCIATLDGLLAICRLKDGVSLFEIALASQLVDLAAVVMTVENALKCLIVVASWNGVVYVINDSLELRKFETGVAPQCITKPSHRVGSKCLAIVSLTPSSLILYEMSEYSSFFNPSLFGQFHVDHEFMSLLKQSSFSSSSNKTLDVFIHDILYNPIHTCKSIID